MTRFFTWFLFVSLTGAALLDRVDITVGDTVITELQLEEDLRVTAFLNGEDLKEDEAARRSAAGRLIQQVLIERDMDLSRYPEAPQESVDEEFARIREEYGPASHFEQSLTQYGIDETVLKRHLSLQVRTLRFIGFRFRPDINVSDEELRRRYQNQIRGWSTSHPGEPVPDFKANVTTLRNEVIEERTDQTLAAWLEEGQSQIRIVYFDPALRPLTK